MATFYFNSAVDGDWQTLGNWWMNSIHTIPAIALPTSTDDVIAYPIDGDGTYDPNITNSGSVPTVANLILKDTPGHVGTYYYNLSMEITVSGLASLEDTAALLGSINGNCTISDNASIGLGGFINGNAIFNDYSINNGIIDNNAIFNGTINNGDVYGTAIFNGGLNQGDYPGIVHGYVTFNSANNEGVYLDGAEFNGTSVNLTTYNCVGNSIFNDSSVFQLGTLNGNVTFNDSSFAYPSNGTTISYGGSVTFQNRTPYPLKRGVNSSSLLGIV